jgi:hypothetical protein
MRDCTGRRDDRRGKGAAADRERAVDGRRRAACSSLVNLVARFVRVS